MSGTDLNWRTLIRRKLIISSVRVHSFIHSFIHSFCFLPSFSYSVPLLSSSFYHSGLFHDSGMTFVIEREQKNRTEVEPTMEEMVEKALQILKKNPKGFFLLVEGKNPCASPSSLSLANAAVNLPMLQFPAVIALCLLFIQAEKLTGVITMEMRILRSHKLLCLPSLWQKQEN